MRFEDEITSEYRQGLSKEIGEPKAIEPNNYTYTVEESNDGYNVVRYKEDNSYKTILFKTNTEKSANEYLQSLKFILG